MLVFSYDHQADAAYIRVSEESVARSVEKTPGIVIDLDRKGRVVGVELLSPRKVSLTAMSQISKQYKVPELATVDPRVIPQLYAA
jgi:uncharacterized protein YuzE